MSDLAEVFELAHRAREAFRSVRATVRTWRDEELSQEAFARFHEQTADERGRGMITMYGFSESDEEEPSETEEVTRLWLERPARRREEIEGRHPRTFVTDGERAWSWDPHMGAIEYPEPDAGATETAALFRPAGVLAGLELEPLGRTTLRGREAIRVRGRPRQARIDDFFRSELSPGADEHEFVLDAERGVLLRATASLDGRIFATTEVLEIAFGEELSPETFVFVPPSGEVVRRPEEAFGPPEHDLTLGEAVALAHDRRTGERSGRPRRLGVGGELGAPGAGRRDVRSCDAAAAAEIQARPSRT